MTKMLEGKTIVVAGVGTGLGGQVGRLAYREGANVVLAARTANTLEDVAKEIAPDQDRILTVPTDITDNDQCKRLADAAGERFGGIGPLGCCWLWCARAVGAAPGQAQPRWFT